MKPSLISHSILSSCASWTTRELVTARGATEVKPQVSGSPQVIANVTDPSVTRDSCGSVKIGNRALWACRDTEAFDASTGQPKLPVIPNTASWTDFNHDGSPKLQTNAPVGAGSSGSNSVLLMYGGNPTSTPAFFPVPLMNVVTRVNAPTDRDTRFGQTPRPWFPKRLTMGPPLRTPGSTTTISRGSRL